MSEIITNTFFELIRVAIGTQENLSRMPKADEWGELYKMAKKQSLVGICFVALQRLGANADDGFDRIGMSEMLYLTWMGMAAKIQQKNEVVNRQCVELQARLAAEGMASRVLKGQGVGQLYAEHLSGLRQSGDIDLWVIAPKEKVVEWAQQFGLTDEPGYLHVGVRCFEDTEVELHYRTTYMRSLRHNKRLQEFCVAQMSDYRVRDNIVVPSWEFDVVYQLSHIYRHLFGLGVGLRQLMDYYWTLSSSPTSTGSAQRLKGENFDLQNTLKYLGLYDFAGAVMYVMREVFGMDEKYMICAVDEQRGRMLLRQVMQTGNFGMMDKVQKEARSTTAGSVKYKLSQWWELLKFYPEETLSAPLWALVRKISN